jgi:ABC-2 type transport system ATP-binding protein
VLGDTVIRNSRVGQLDLVQQIVTRVPESAYVSVEGNAVRFHVGRGADVLLGLLRYIDAAGVELASVEVRRPSLDDVFFSVTGRTLSDAAASGS